MSVGVVVAMPEESEGYDAALALEGYRRAPDEPGPVEVARYVGEGLPDVLLATSGVGKANAAIAATVLLTRHAPTLVVNSGSAGGVSPGLRVGDVVLGGEARYVDADATAFGYELGQVPRMPASYRGDPDSLLALTELDPSLLVGVVGTSDSFVTTWDSGVHPTVACVEMEAAAIAQACHVFGVPFVAVKAVSDTADGDSASDFPTFVRLAGLRTGTLAVRLLVNANRKSLDGTFLVR